MHELSIAQSIVNIVQGYAQKNDVKRIVSVVISIGKLSGVVPEALKFCLSICTKGTLLEGARIDIEEITSIARCDECLTHFDLIRHEFSCPSCGSSKWTIISGKELYIKEIEVT